MNAIKFYLYKENGLHSLLVPDSLPQVKLKRGQGVVEAIPQVSSFSNSM
jgi:hypothetical protein